MADNTDYSQREAETLSKMPLKPSRVPRGSQVSDEDLETTLILDEEDLLNVTRPKDWVVE